LIDNAGFYLYRAEKADGEYVKINNALIPAKRSSTQGTTYEYTDSDVQNRKTYYTIINWKTLTCVEYQPCTAQ
jgi:hypothetical protein